MAIINYGNLGQLSVINGEICVIPASLREQKLEALHQYHQGQAFMVKLAKVTGFLLN